MKELYAGGGDFPIQQTMQIDYAWQDRLIQWAQSMPLTVILILALIVFILWKVKR